MSEKSKTEIISENLIKAFVQFKKIHVNEINTTFDQDQLQHCLKHSEVMLLFELKEIENDYPNGVSVSVISDNLRVKSPSITPIITSLEQKNMLERIMDINDRRIIRVKLKEAGNKLIEESKLHMILGIKGLVEYLGDEKSETLANLINESFIFISSQADHKKKP
jgi:DNA-binding MarR family transcriptional regulator